MMEEFKIMEREMFGGIQLLYKFPNGYGASIVKHKLSYGREKGLWELAVLKFDKEDNWHLCYDTPITDDALGYLTNHEVLVVLNKIKELKRYERKQ